MTYDFDRALWLAVGVHRGQKDKGGAPYILHVIRVALRMDTDIGRVTAVLHDVLEDEPCGWNSADCIRAWFGAEVLKAVQLLTRAKGEDYLDYIRRLSANPLAAAVKLADLEDNLDPDRPGEYVLPLEKRELYLLAQNLLLSRRLEALEAAGVNNGQ